MSGKGSVNYAMNLQHVGCPDRQHLHWGGFVTPPFYYNLWIRHYFIRFRTSRPILPLTAKMMTLVAYARHINV